MTQENLPSGSVEEQFISPESPGYDEDAEQPYDEDLEASDESEDTGELGESDESSFAPSPDDTRSSTDPY